jgi:predicted AlkP superfamily pyrophosphatase or phosphodiesterase
MAKTIFILIDGCGDAVAKNHFGYLEHMAEAGAMARYTVRGELPSSSRPIYETLLTGLPVSKHGITGNLVCRNSRSQNVFSLCRENDRATAAAAYYWVSELYSHAPFVRAKTRIQLKTDTSVQNGIYYFEDSYPDSHVLCDGAYLIGAFAPDFTMIHTMNIDDAGHRFGEGSGEQAACAMKLDAALSASVPVWIKEGYHIVVTSDHGMDEHGTHGGNRESLRVLPLYIYSSRARPVMGGETVSQLSVAPLLCHILGIPKGNEMADIRESGVELIG